MAQNLDFNALVPGYLKNETLTSLNENLFNRFVSHENSVAVEGHVGLMSDGQNEILQPDLERQQNDLIPGIYLASGPDEYIFTFSDIVNKLRTLNADVDNMRDWMAEQHFNFSPPIDYDKFINFQNYYWVGDLIDSNKIFQWNLEKKPEYYVIARPKADDAFTKVPVRLATTRNIGLYANDRPPEKITVTFSSSLEFSVSSDIDANIRAVDSAGLPIASLVTNTPGHHTKIVIQSLHNDIYPSVSDPSSAGSYYDVLEFYIINGGVGTTPVDWSVGDSIEINFEHNTAQFTATVSSTFLSGKGTASGVKTLAPLMFIDGVRVRNGDRILVTNQLDPHENGIYVVSTGGKWDRATDSYLNKHFTMGQTVFVEEGILFANNSFTLLQKNNASAETDLLDAELVFGNVTPTISSLNDWQYCNYWTHRDDLAQLEMLGITTHTAPQAVRPIIEFSNTLEMNNAVSTITGLPCHENALDAATFIPVKTAFNQLPQFNMYRYDGTHAGLTSGIWFYKESTTAPLDTELLRRIEATVNTDYVFSHGTVDSAGRLLFFRLEEDLVSIWRAGPSSPQISYMYSDGKPILNGQIVTVSAISDIADTQEWTLSISADGASFGLSGHRSGLIGEFAVDTPHITEEFTIDVNSSAIGFLPGSKIIFRIENKLAPRYVKSTGEGTDVINYPGGPAADAIAVEKTGAWLTPLRMLQNMDRETRKDIAFGDFLNHARSVLRHQPAFIGSSYGNNNARELDINQGLGGKIREFDSNFQLLTSLSIHPDVSPLTIIDFAEQQYNASLASVDRFLLTTLAQWVGQTGYFLLTENDPDYQSIVDLADSYIAFHNDNVNLQAVFGDTTNSIPNWPITLPMMGLVAAVEPSISYDQERNQWVIVHHDGHYSPLALFDTSLNFELTKTLVTRSDGNITPGSYSPVAPTAPYRNQLWMNSSTSEMFIFNVDFDSDTAPISASAGQVWFKRNTGELLLRQASTWVPAPASFDPWERFYPELVRNSLILNIEKRLFASVHPKQHFTLDILGVNSEPAAQEYRELELARFSAQYGYDTYAPDFNEDDAFTWNYTNNAVIHGTARWHTMYAEYFSSFNAVNLIRPDLQPWKLGTASQPAIQSEDMPLAWMSEYLSTATPGPTSTTARLILRNNVAYPILGVPVIDGVQAINGDKILVVGQTFAWQNGVYTVNNVGQWTRDPITLESGLAVTVQHGNLYANTTWVVTTSDPIVIDTTPVTFEQVRVWKEAMWYEIKQHNPGIRLCVDVVTDELIPPYVSSSAYQSSESLMQDIPSGIELGYVYGDRGPVENVWEKSIEYLYGAARTAFRLNPLRFLDKSWGETYVSSGDNLRLERNMLRSLSHRDFTLHGEKLKSVNALSPQQVQDRISISASDPLSSIVWDQTFTGSIKFVVTHCADSNDESISGENLGPSGTVFSIFVNDVMRGFAIEGLPFSLTVNDEADPALMLVSFTNITINDLGIPYNMGDTLIMNITAGQIIEEMIDEGVDYVYGLLGCVGCAHEASPDLTRTIVTDTSLVTYQFAPAVVKSLSGLGQLFTNVMRFNFVDVNSSLPVAAFRDWQMKLVHRFGALIRPDSLRVKSPVAVIDETGYSTLIKRSTMTRDYWISGLRVQLLQMGSKKLSPSGLFVPSADSADWVYRVESYNPSHPFIDYNVLDTSGSFDTFHILDRQNTDLVWKRYVQATGTARITTPIQITGLQNVINLIFGYVDQLTENNFTVVDTEKPLLDSDTGRVIDWQLEIEKMVNSMYSGISAGSGVILNPFMDKLILKTPVGLLGRYASSKFTDAYTTQACFDVTGKFIPVEQLSVIRRDDVATTYSQTPIFSAHLFIDEYEHALILNDRISSSSESLAMFDQFLGQSVPSLFLGFQRQALINGKPTFDGYVLSGNSVRRNMMSSVDALQNAYDSTLTFADRDMSEHALALVGFKPKEYMQTIDIGSATQFNFWRGMISAKGSSMSINAFTNYKSFSKSSVDEFWAYKVAEYGDARERSFPEIKINSGDCFRKFVSLQFYSKDDPAYEALPLFTQIESADDDRWFSIDDLGTVLRFDADAITETLTAQTAGYIRLNNVYHNGDAFAPKVFNIDVNGIAHVNQNCRIVNATTIHVTEAGTYRVSGYTWNNQAKLSPVKLYDYRARELEGNISLWHPAAGIHAPSALELVNITSKVDPANYNYSSQVIDNPNFIALKPWGENEVGRVWWDTSDRDYIPYYDADIFPNRESRNSRWGSLSEWGSIDLYEWTESPVHPSEYNALAKKQEGDSTIDQSVRLSGQVGHEYFYKSNRSITVRPIAWSNAGANTSAAHPAFGSTADTTIFITGDAIITEAGRPSSFGITSGRHLAAWDSVTNKPIGEIVIGDQLRYLVGSYILPEDPSTVEKINTPVIVLPPPIDNISFNAITVTQLPQNNMFGSRVGQISITSFRKDINEFGEPPNWYVRMVADDGYYEDVIVQRWTSSNLPQNDNLNIDFETFGLRITLNATSASGSIDAEKIVEAVSHPANDVFVRETVDFSTIIPLPDQILSNRSVFPLSPVVIDYGWVAWDNPTTLDLRGDLPSPRNKWKPYFGDDVIVDISPDVIAEIQKPNNKWTMPNGEVIEKYVSTWSDWEKMNNVTADAVSDGLPGASFDIQTDDFEIVASRLSVYANGTQINPNDIRVDLKTVTIINAYPEGTHFHMLYRMYRPAEQELSFDPAVKDNFSILSRYRADYQYTVKAVRNSAGNIVGNRYYFWVKNKSTVKAGKAMSLKNAAKILQFGESEFILFSRMVQDANSHSGASYDSCAIRGLNNIVTQNDTYKLRFLRDFSLRDDPQELKLKNKHTEWTIIRERQSVKIPQKLWTALTNSVCAMDAAGNALPSQVRINYDAKYGTRTRYGFNPGQIMVEASLAMATVIYTILNTALTVDIGVAEITDYITFFDIDASSTPEQIQQRWFSDPETARNTMNRIFETARSTQVNEIFFAVMNDALSNNYEFTDLFKTSMIMVNSSSVIEQNRYQLEQQDDFF